MTLLTSLFRASTPLLCLALAACGKKTPDGASSATLERAALMQLAFPGWSEKGAGHKQTLLVPGSVSGETDANKKPVDVSYDELVDPEFVVRLTDDDATMIIRANRLEDNGEIQECHACGVDYGAIQFHRYDDKWFLVNRQNVFTTAGSMGMGDSPEIIKLAQHVFALKLGSYYMQMGEETNSTQLYELTPSGPRDLVKKWLQLSADNEGMVADCSEPSAKDRNKPLPEEDQSECFKIDVRWSLDATGETPGDLTLQYTGFTRLQGDDNLYRYHHVNDKTVWRYQGGQYVQVSGTNPFDQVAL
jgi:hypothetical protein